MIRTNKEFLHYCKDELKIGNSSFFEKGELLVRQDDYIRNLLIIEHGLVKCFRMDENGKEFVQEFFGTGELIGEVETILGPHQEKSIANIEALSSVSCVKISCSEFQTLLANNYVFNELILKHLSQKIRYKGLRHAYVQTHSLEENIRRLDDEFLPYFDLIKKKDLSDYLGVTLRSLNRALKDISRF